MNHQQERNLIVTEKLGLVTGYFIFTTTLFFILKFSGRMPRSWNYFNIMLVAFLITLFGGLIKKYYHGKI